uniref:Uncharacterized protein n=1 Tax=Panagrolaimus davidi TaxID=227884 RepID=A0A914PLF4_9BILA
MIWKTWFSKGQRINLNETSVIQFEDGRFQFSLTPQELDLEKPRKYQTFNIVTVKGEFEITGFSARGTCVNFDKKENTVYFETSENEVYCSITIKADMKYTKIGYVCVPYKMSFTSSHMNFLKVYDFNEGIITLPYYSMLKFKYYIKRICSYYVEIVIENPYDLKIDGKNGDFTHQQKKYEDVDLNLSFEFDPNMLSRK